METKKKSYAGVYQLKSGSWTFTYQNNGKKIWGGSFDTQIEAYLARVQLTDYKPSVIAPLQGEVWVDAYGHDGYMVSNMGRVKSLSFNRTGFEGLLKEQSTNRGYVRVMFAKDAVSVHRLVWESFNGPIVDGITIHHKDEDKLNNKIQNLDAVTPVANSRAYYDGLRQNKVGVFKNYDTRQWEAFAKVGEKYFDLGSFAFKEEGLAFYIDFLAEHGITP